ASGFTTYLWSGILFCLSVFTTPILTYNLQVVSNFLLSAFITYLLVAYLTKNRLSAIFSGIIFAFCPYQLMRAWQHFGLTYNEWIPLSLLAAVLLKDKPDKTKKIFFLISIVLLFSFDYTITYLGVITLIVFCVYILFYNWRIKFFKQKSLLVSDLMYLKRLIILGFISFIILLPQFFPIIKNLFGPASGALASDFNLYHRPFEHLFDMAAKPLSYFLPAAVHPVLGKFTEQFIGSSLYGLSFTEHTLYLGWTPLILSFIAFRRWRRRRKQYQRQFPKSEDSPFREDFYIGFFILLAIVAWLFSQAPWWNLGPIKIYMPSFFMYKILPMFRAYCRFGIVVMFAIALLAGFGLKFILEKFKSRRTKIIITSLFCGLVLFEFWNWPPYKVIDVSKVPAVYYWLKGQAENFVIAEYPLDTSSPSEKYKFYQTTHEKKIINFTIPGTYAHELAKSLTRLSDPYTAGVLKWLGVKYALVHRGDYLKTELIDEIEELKRIPKNRGLKLIKSFSAEDCSQNIRCTRETGPIDVYEVAALPIKPKIEAK
ncbi:MAG: YfhO family protein, partial [Candidatus Omnitrophica bacterium]|nr:YfhO family protein [Candidatus Omnitrophota bacterium]